MAKITGKWRIAEMDLRDQQDLDLQGPAFIEFDKTRSGQFQFIAVDGNLDCRHGERSGRPYVEFTWDGSDECDSAHGRGWAELWRDGSLRGHIYFHDGDDSGFKAIPFQSEHGILSST